MYILIKQLFQLLSFKQRLRFFKLQLLVIVMSVCEVVSVLSIVPFMSIVGDPSIIEAPGFLGDLFRASGLDDINTYLISLGFAVLVLLVFSALISMLTTWQLSMFANEIGVELADELFQYYLNQPWLYHTSISSAQLTKKLANETNRVTTLILLPLLHLNAKVTLAAFMVGLIFVVDWIVAISGAVIFGVAYSVLYKIVRNRLLRNGRLISNLLELRFKIKNDSFGGIKDIILSGRQRSFTKSYSEIGKKLAYSQGSNVAMAHVPRYCMELVVFGSMIGLVLYLIGDQTATIGSILPSLSLFAIAGFKMLPAMQQIYSSIAQIRGNAAAFEAIRDDLFTSKNAVNYDLLNSAEDMTRLHLKKSLVVTDLTFSYPTSVSPVFEKLNLTIKANTTVGFVGPSGSGKSTLIDLFSGLVEPTMGRILVDDQVLNDRNLRSWQNNVGFVPQQIFLCEGSIAQNVAFGIPDDLINFDQVDKAIKLAHLDEFTAGLPNGIDSQVGERGVQLSGGQRQRIGIARALYGDVDVLIFDEATSALDGLTEKEIMESVNRLSGEKTIIMVAHRLKTIQNCDQIFVVDQGKILTSGTFTQLQSNSEYFRKLAQNA